MNLPITASFRSVPSPKKPPVEVVVIIPSHNYGRFLARAIDSVLAQTVRPREMLVMDDASTDATKDIALSYAEQGVRYLRVEYRDLAATRNHGARETSASFLVYLDADDYLAPDYLEKCLEQCKDPRVGFAYGDVQKFGEDTAFLRSQDFDSLLLSYHNYISSHAMIRREALEFVGGYRSIPHSLEDWDIYRRIVAANYIGRRADTRSFYFIHHDSMLQTHLASQHATYANSAALLSHPITICTVFTGNSFIVSEYLKALSSLHFDKKLIHLSWCTISKDPVFNRSLRSHIEFLPFRSVQFIDGSDFENACWRQNQEDALYPEKTLKTKAYHCMIRRCDTDYIFFLGEDIAVSPDILLDLLSAMQEEIVAMAAPVRSISEESYEIWKSDDDQHCRLVTERGAGLEKVCGCGFGCTLFRTASLKAIVPLSIGQRFGELLPYDHFFFSHICLYGKTYCNWDRMQERISSESRS